MTDYDENTALQLELLRIGTLEGGEMWFGLPSRWIDNPHWRCRNDHVSRRYLKSEAKGYNACLECYEPVFLTFPEDKDGPLEKRTT